MLRRRRCLIRLILRENIPVEDFAMGRHLYHYCMRWEQLLPHSILSFALAVLPYFMYVRGRDAVASEKRYLSNLTLQSRR